MTLYHGGCQCGAVRFRVEASLDHPVICNCSRCRRLGSVLVFAPRGDFVLERGEDSLTEFRFNREVIRHLFCKTCGIQSFSFGTAPDGAEMAAVNANCLDGVDGRALAARAVAYDGAAA